MKRTPTIPETDVCLLLEGTYPYAKGGVSTWVHQLIEAMPDLRFSLVYIGAEKKLVGVQKYNIPENVADLTEIYLFDEPERVQRARFSAKKLRRVHEALWYLFDEGSVASPDEDQLRRAIEVFAELAVGGDFEKFYAHPRSWSLLTKLYHEYFSEESFTHFFWSVKSILRPLWHLFQVLPQLPEKAVYHSVSTGYAGMLGAVAARRFSQPYILSEHGIYVRERITELLGQEWAPEMAAENVTSNGISALRQLWIDFFVQVGRYAYSEAGEIVALFQKNADLQVEFGAPSDRIQVIPNGVDPDKFNVIARDRMEQRVVDPDRKVVGFLGRVVSIKDVKTLVRAARLVLQRVPEAQFVIAGSTDEEPGYFQECVSLVETLGIEEGVHFVGPKVVADILPTYDLLVLSSLSEDLSFTILEAFSTGIPVVATDVGCCQDLIDGHPSEQPPLGPAGRVVPSGDSSALADSLIVLLQDRTLQDRLGRTGRARIECYYSEERVIDAYRALYTADTKDS